jgi:hypothetical protein
VSVIVDPAMYVVGDFGLFVDGEADAGLAGGANQLAEVFVGDTGDVHLAGWYYNSSATPAFQAAYWKNGARTMLPTTWTGATLLESDAWGLTVSGANVYVAGSEIRYRPGSDPDDEEYEYMAKLWVNGVAQTLEGAGAVDGSGAMLSSQARAVRVHAGSVYVAGFSEDAGHNVRATIWKDGARFQMTGLEASFQNMVIDTAGNIYCRYSSNIYKVAANLLSYETITLDGSGGAKLGMAVDGADWYVVGWMGNDAYYWKNNGAATLLPRPAGATWVEAHSAHVHNGTLYVAGVRSQSGYYTQLWKGGADVLLTDDVAIKTNYSSSATAKPWWIFVK